MVEVVTAERRIGILMTGYTIPSLEAAHGTHEAMYHRTFRDVAPNFSFKVYSIQDDEFPESPADCDAWIITGSPHGVYDDLPWIAPLIEFVQRVAAANVPLAGICFGHQLIAQALGGRAVKHSGGWNLGVIDYQVTEAGRAAGLPMPAAGSNLQLYASHQDQVTAVPPDATVLAQASDCAIAALAYGDVSRPRIVTIQPHPEFTGGFVADLVRLRRGQSMPEDKADSALATIDRPVDNSEVAAWMAQTLSGHARSDAAG